MSEFIGLDFETYGGVDLPKHGLDRYVKDPTFRPLIAHTYTTHTAAGGYVEKHAFDFVHERFAKTNFIEYIMDSAKTLAAHNAPFEVAVCDWLGLKIKPGDIVDTAVLARMNGAGGKLEAAAPQLLGVDKMAEGWDLIKLFSLPGKLQEANGSLEFDPDIFKLYPDEFHTFGVYCGIDAMLSHNLADEYYGSMTLTEFANEDITNEMNATGWPVDLDLVHVMRERYQANLAATLENFYDWYQPGVDKDKRLNFNSFPQQRDWCADRGMRARSFDELHVKKMLVAIEKKLAGKLTDDKREKYQEIVDFLHVKQELGGVSLKKLDTILAMTSADGRLRNQYLHIGAGQTWRTTGRGVQMQNLKRLGEDLLDMDTLYEEDVEVDSTVLSQNLRQVFCASEKDGALIVGDFASVESRKLAWLARANWKTSAFFGGKDMYKVLASQMFNVHYDDVLKPQRQTGKVGELSCGYGAGPDAVKDFAEKMGTVFTLAEATSLVHDWRQVNPEVVTFWEKLDQMLHTLVVDGKTPLPLEVGEDGFTVHLQRAFTPASLQKQHPGAQSIRLTMRKGTQIIVKRTFHGCYVRGRGIGYYKPSERKTGDLWKNNYVNPKTKQLTFYTLYGGKLTGILTQSSCRELFFNALRRVKKDFENISNVEIIGQFHDEIVLNWWPIEDRAHPDWSKAVSLSSAKARLEHAMSDPGVFTGFPLAAEIKHDYRYTK